MGKIEKKIGNPAVHLPCKGKIFLYYIFNTNLLWEIDQGHLNI